MCGNYCSEQCENCVCGEEATLNVAPNMPVREVGRNYVHSFSEVAEAVGNGYVAGRASWLLDPTAPKAIFLVPGSLFSVNRAPLSDIFPDGTVVSYKPHVDAIYGVEHSEQGDIAHVGVYRYTLDDTSATDWAIYTKAELLL